MAIRGGLREQFDWARFVTVAVIALAGVTNLYSATSAAVDGLADIYMQQIYWLALGAGVAVATSISALNR